MLKLRILVDMDDTIEGLGEAWVEWLNKKHGTNVVWQKIREWDMSKSFPTLTEKEIYAPLCERAFWEGVKPLPDAAKYLQRLIDDDNEVYIVTASHPATFGLKYETVIKTYFPFIDWNNIVMAKRKQIISADILIDDGPHNLEGGLYAGILMDAPHNKNYDEKERGFVRVKTWKEAYREVQKIAKELEEKWGSEIG